MSAVSEPTVLQEERVSFPVDLRKEEYVEFQMVMSRRFGALRMQKPLLLLMLAEFVFGAAFSAYVFVTQQLLDWVMIGCTLCTALVGLLLVPLTTHFMRKNAEKSYEAADSDGYYGTITIDETGLEKQSAYGTVTVPFSPESLFVETANGMAFLTSGSARNVMLPARCLTEEDAAYIRRLVFARSCPMRRQVVARMNAAAAQHIPSRAVTAASDEEYLTLRFSYTLQELLRIFTERGIQRYKESLPLTLMIATFLGVMLALLEENPLIGGVAAALILLLYLWLSVGKNRSRIKQAVAMDERVLQQCVTFTQSGIRMRTGDEQQPTVLQWKAISRAIEKPDCVEFCSPVIFLRIPKRAIDDMEAFRRLVDDHLQK